MQLGYHAALALIATASFSLPAFAAEPDAPASLITRTESLRIAVEDRLQAKFSSSSARKAEQDALVKYYAVSDQALLWVDENGLNQRGKAIIAEIKKADDYGLRASDYALPNPDGFNDDAKANDWLADAEIKISYAVLDYARDARGGRIDPQRLSENLDPTLALPDPTEVIQSIASRTDPAMYLRSFQPDQPQFEALRRKLIELRGSDRNSKKTGANNGKIGAILVNMERWRWLPNDLGPYYVNVNVPEFMLRVVDGGKVIHTARVVVGKRDKQTPIFSKEMQEIVFNPVWNVPTSIKTEEILPWLNSGGGFFGGGYSTAIFEATTCTSSMGAERSIRVQSIGAASIFAIWKSISRRDLITCLVMLNSCSPTSTTYICMTPQRGITTGSHIGPRVMVACVCKIPISLPSCC